MNEKRLPPARHAFKIFRRVSMRWRDNDTYGHVNNAVYYEYFDTAVNEYLLESTGTDTRKLPAIGVVLETSCRFFESVTFPGTLDIGLAVTYVGQSSVQYRLGVFQAGALLASAEGRFIHVYVDAVTRKKSQLPSVIRDVVMSLQVD